MRRELDVVGVDSIDAEYEERALLSHSTETFDTRERKLQRQRRLESLYPSRRDIHIEYNDDGTVKAQKIVAVSSEE